MIDSLIVIDYEKKEEYTKIYHHYYRSFYFTAQLQLNTVYLNAKTCAFKISVFFSKASKLTS